MKPPLLVKPHILFISSWYPTRENPTHGIFNRYFAEAVSRHCQVSAISVSSDRALQDEHRVEAQNSDGIFTVHVCYKKVTLRIPLLSQLVKYSRSRRALLAGYAVIEAERGKPDLIQLNVVMPLGPLALFLARRLHVPYVISENWSGYTKEDGNYRGFLQKWATQKVVRHARRIMPTSAYLQAAMQSHGLRGNYTVVPNVVDTEKFRILPRPADGVTRFIHVSSLNDREKNVSGLLRAFADASKAVPGTELVIIGTGIDEPAYRKLAESDGLRNKVVFRGRLSRDELVKELARCDALVMFSNYETFCLVIPEALACGKPVITSAAGAIPSYMREDLGTMVTVGDEDALARAIIGFAGSPGRYDSQAIRQYAVDHFSYEKVGKTLAGIYTETLQTG